jgi:hypothetical protein
MWPNSERRLSKLHQSSNPDLQKNSDSYHKKNEKGFVVMSDTMKKLRTPQDHTATPHFYKRQESANALN